MFTQLELKAFNVEISNHGLEGKNLPKKLKVLSWGKNETNDGDVWLTDATAKVFDSMMKKTGRFGKQEVALDFDHCTVPDSKEYVAGKAKDIAAYGTAELIKDDGLYLTDLEWTPLGKEKAKNYQDLSPACAVTKDGVVTALHSVALTPNGAVKGLKFYSANGFDDMINKMSVKEPGLVFKSVGDKGASNPKDTTMLDIDDYNKDGANPSLTKVGNNFKLNPHVMDSSDMGTYDANKHDDHDEDCMCTNCMDASDSDHYSKYGDVDYADKENHKYPVDTEKHTRAAWSYINMPKNASKYNSSKLSTIKSNIKTAAKKHGITIAESVGNTNKTKTMSANNPSFPDAYKAQDWQYNTMNNSIIKNMSITDAIKQMAADVGTENESASARVLFAFLAEWLGLKSEIDGQITHKDNTEEGGLKQFAATFAATIDAMKQEIESLKNEKSEENKRHSKFERETLVRQAAKEGKIIPLSANEIETVDVNILKSIVSNQPKYTVPLSSTMRTMNADTTNKPSKESAVKVFEAMLNA